MNVPQFTLKEVYLILKGLRAAWRQKHDITATGSLSGFFKSNKILARLRQTNVFVQDANEGGNHDVPVFTAEFHRRLYPVVHHKS